MAEAQVATLIFEDTMGSLLLFREAMAAAEMVELRALRRASHAEGLARHVTP